MPNFKAIGQWAAKLLTLWQYTTSESKNKTPYLCRLLHEILIDFQNSFTARLSTKSATKWSLHISPHLKGIVAQPCETVMFQLLASSGANIHAIFGLLLPRFQSVLPFSSVSSAVYQACVLSSFSQKILLITLANHNLQTSVNFLSVLCHLRN